MARGYRPVDRDQQYLLPPDMREWLPPGHLVWFVISVIDSLDISEFEAGSRLGGVGRAGYAPRMLLTVLVYGYAMGVKSSRQIERLCRSDVAFRIACAQDVPDHTTLSRFRKDREDAVRGLFTQVLQLCGKAGLAKLGTVAIDGTKIAANASDYALRSEKWLREEVEKILAEAEQVDAREDALFGDALGDELPADLADPVTRQDRIKKALADIEAEKSAKVAERSEKDKAKAQAWVKMMSDPTLPSSEREHPGRAPRGVDPVVVAQMRLDRAVAAHQQKLDSWERRKAQAAALGRKPSGRAPVSMEACVRVARAREALERAKERAAAGPPPRERPGGNAKEWFRNITDPDARSMATRKGWVQGYNAQLAVSQDQVILVADVVQNPADNVAFVPMLTELDDAVRVLTACGSSQTEVGVVLADAGYRSVENVTVPGPARLIATGQGRDDARRARQEPTSGPPPEGADPLEAMDHRLRTPEGRELYRQRAPMVEGTNGQLKDVIGLRRFSRRGLRAVRSDLDFAATVHNILKLFRAAPAMA
ncbi:transposase [Georgenia sp. AZ-5]|uniref:transposase n=1 Tax=Georgenia sp. AZ-5 TaxID=3367526 RepID=UPI0037545BD9